MQRITKTCILGYALISVSCAAGYVPKPPPTLYDNLGGQDGVSQIVKGTLSYTLSDPRIAHTFENSNVARVETLLIEQICELTGGPCEYTGQTMERSHRGLNLTTSHFNSLVENLQKSMEDESVPFAAQNKLLAILAPMHSDVTGQPKR